MSSATISFAGGGDQRRAIAILKLNTELYATSSNTYDSLGEAYLASGDQARALQMYGKVMEVLPGDGKTDAAQKERLLRNAESKIGEFSK